MKNKFFIRAAVFLLILLCFAKNGFSQTYIEVSPLYEFKNGCLNELVFANVDNQAIKLSELNWNIKNISYLGGKLAVHYNWVHLESSIVGGFSKQSAKMYDSDWQDIPDSPDMKTTFSISENELKKNISFNSKAAFTPDITNWLKAGVFLQYKYDMILFSARNGYGWYGSNRYSQNGQYVPYDSEYAKFFATGSLQGIDYYRITRTFNIGLTCCFTIFNTLQIQLEAGISPYNSVKSLDHHYSPSSLENYYRDEITSKFSLYSFGTDVKIHLLKNIYAGCAFSYNYLKEKKGKTYLKQEAHGYTDMIFKDLNEYIYDSTSWSGASGEWYTITAYCSFIF